MHMKLIMTARTLTHSLSLMPPQPLYAHKVARAVTRFRSRLDVREPLESCGGRGLFWRKSYTDGRALQRILAYMYIYVCIYIACYICIYISLKRPASPS